MTRTVTVECNNCGQRIQPPPKGLSMFYSAPDTWRIERVQSPGLALPGGTEFDLCSARCLADLAAKFADAYKDVDARHAAAIRQAEAAAADH